MTILDGLFRDWNYTFLLGESVYCETVEHPIFDVLVAISLISSTGKPGNVYYGSPAFSNCQITCICWAF